MIWCSIEFLVFLYGKGMDDCETVQNNSSRLIVLITLVQNLSITWKLLLLHLNFFLNAAYLTR